MYQVYDRQTGKPCGAPSKTLKAASAKANRLDLAYGAIRYGWKRVEEAQA